jgi:hypothetical protein
MLLERLCLIVFSIITLAAFSDTAIGAEVCIQANDPMDLPLPNAWIRATRWSDTAMPATTTPMSYTATTDNKGRACLTLREGSYAIEVGLSGFLNVRYSPVRVFPARSIQLTYRLPIGDILEGGVAPESILSGTLTQGDAVISGVSICAFQASGKQVVGCTHSDAMGEYALAVPPGNYRIEIRTPNGKVHVSEIDVTEPGMYRNRLKLGLESARQPDK